jgi:tetratricopeptide (TPR) repeat protein
MAIRPAFVVSIGRKGLGSVSFRRGQAVGGSFRQARSALGPKIALYHSNLGADLVVGKSLAAAVAEFGEAIWLGLDLAEAHTNLGLALFRLGDLEQALFHLREAGRLDPNSAEVHVNLGEVLRARGSFAESLVEFSRAHELGSKRPGWHHPSGE